MSQIRSEAGNTGFIIKASLLIIVLSAIGSAIYDVYYMYQAAMLLQPGFPEATEWQRLDSMLTFYAQQPQRLGWAALEGAGWASGGIGALLYIRAIRQNKAHKQTGGKNAGGSMTGPKI